MNLPNDPDSLKTAAAVAQATIAFIGIALTCLLYVRQRRHAKLEALKWIHDKVSTSDFRDALRTIFEAGECELKGKPSRRLSESISLVTCQYDLLGAGTKAGVFLKKAVLMTEWKILIPLWQRLEPFVKAERDHRQIQAYKEYFEWLAAEAKDYAKRKAGIDPNKIPWVIPRDTLRTPVGPGGGPTPRLDYEGKHLQFYDVPYGDGKCWEFVRRTGRRAGVTIVAVAGQKHLLMVEQYRPPLDKRTIELPAGLVGDQPGTESERGKMAAIRELKQETTFDCVKISWLAEGSLLPGITDEKNTFYLAEVEQIPSATPESFELNVKGGNAQEGEVIPVIYAVPLSEVVPWLEKQSKAGKVVDLRIYAGLFFLKLNGLIEQQSVNNSSERVSEGVRADF